MSKEFDVEVEGRAFLLRPDTPREGTPRKPRPGEEGDQLSEPLRSRAEESGLVMRRSELIPNTLYVLEASEYAKEQQCFDDFHHAVYRAYWEDKKNIGDLEVLGEIARGSGLNWPELRDRLESGYYSETVMSQYQEAIGLGIKGIPAFLIDNFLFTGAQNYEVFKMVMKRVMDGQGGATGRLLT